MTEPMLSTLTSQPWWRTDDYTNTEAVPEILNDLSGPLGLALVKAWPDGRTDPGWGLDGKAIKDNDGVVVDHEPGFMPRYMKGEFLARRALYGYERDRWAFAIIMRSVRLLCVDIDGKNGGLEHAKRLGQLPVTLAETSKSGNGFHLFYLVEDQWDETVGYGAYNDHIGIEQGVDIRSVGCVYHHKQQRWNYRDVAPLPSHLHDLMLARRQRQEHSAQRIEKVLATGDDMEVLMMQDELVTDLKKPIAQGKRNTTLFAIGQKMKQAGTPKWEDLVAERATEVGLDSDEVDQLVRNIQRYN